jgi:hypothetical protein
LEAYKLLVLNCKKGYLFTAYFLLSVTKEAKTGRTGQISALKLQSSEVGAQPTERTRPGDDPKELRRREERLWEKPRPEDMMSDPRDDIVHIILNP